MELVLLPSVLVYVIWNEFDLAIHCTRLLSVRAASPLKWRQLCGVYVDANVCQAANRPRAHKGRRN